MAQFKVVLDEINLSDRDVARINNAIQRTVLSELANIDQGGDKASVLLEKFGPQWRGFIAYQIDLAQLGQPGFEKLGELNERFEQGF